MFNDARVERSEIDIAGSAPANARSKAASAEVAQMSTSASGPMYSARPFPVPRAASEPWAERPEH
jgi:hypothetical protein